MQQLFDLLKTHLEQSITVWPLVVFFVAGGVAMLKYGADWLVDGAANIGMRLGISSILVGLTIVAFGTSAPELVVSVLTATRHKPEICLGNVIGSNIANIGLVLGVTVLIMPITVKKSSAKYDAPMSFATIALVLILAVLPFSAPVISRLDGIILLAVFATWMALLIGAALRGQKKAAAKSTGTSEDSVSLLPEAVVVVEKEMKIKQRHIAKDILFILSGLAFLVLGADALVAGAVEAAGKMGVSNTVVGLTVVAVGTSLPELAVCVVAALKKQAGITIGNVLGSNIFNAMLILGTATVIFPVKLNISTHDPAGDWGTLFIDIPYCVGLSLLVLPLILHRRKLHRWKGAVLVASYILYITWLVLRNTGR